MAWNVFWSLGCLSVSSAVFLSAYGYHSKGLSDVGKQQWEKAIKYQLLGSTPLLLVRFLPAGSVLACVLGLLGTAMFCGPLYYTAKTGDSTFNRLMPMGGTLIALSWAVLAFA